MVDTYLLLLSFKCVGGRVYGSGKCRKAYCWLTTFFEGVVVVVVVEGGLEIGEESVIFLHEVRFFDPWEGGRLVVELGLRGEVGGWLLVDVF